MPAFFQHRQPWLHIARRIYGERQNPPLCPDPYVGSEGADALATCTEWQTFRSLEFTSLRELLRRLLILDGRYLFDQTMIRDVGFEYVAIGRP